MTTRRNKYRSTKIGNQVIGISVSHDEEDLLRRGLGVEHVRELLLRLARPILRQGANVAYGGNWKDVSTNLTYDLLRVVSAEQEDQGATDQFAESDRESRPKIGKLYNHSAWPLYLDVTPRIEAQWISSCRIVRIDQKLAGFMPEEVVPDSDATKDDPRVGFNRAVTLSAMRHLMMQELSLPIPVPNVAPERIPPVVARIVLGGKVSGYSGFCPGIFEEALVTLRAQQPLFVLGGFGGAAEVLANAMLEKPGSPRPPQLTVAWHRQKVPKLAALLDSSASFRLPAGTAFTEGTLDELYSFVILARQNLRETLHTWLSDVATRELMMTRNVATAVRLVREGLGAKNALPKLPG